MTDLTNSKKENETKSFYDKTKTVQNTGNVSLNDKKDTELADKVGNVVRGDTKAAKDIYDDAKKSTSDVAGKVYDAAADKATSKIDEQKTNLAQGLSSVADNIRQMGDSLRGTEQPHGIAKVTANYGDTLADKVEQFSSYLDDKNLSEMLGDVEKFAHRNPAVFLGGAFALGIVAARFLKSGNPNQALMRRPRYNSKDKYMSNVSESRNMPESFDKQNQKSDAQTKGGAGSADKSASAFSSNKGV